MHDQYDNMPISVTTRTPIKEAWQARRFVLPIYTNAVLQNQRFDYSNFKANLCFLLRSVINDNYYLSQKTIYSLVSYVITKVSYEQPNDTCDISECPIYNLPASDNYIDRVASYIISLVEDMVSDYKRMIKWKEKGYIYFLLAEEVKLVKIGFQSKLDNQRTKSVHSHCPYDLLHLGSIQCVSITSESEIHRKFKYWHYNREWFNYDDELCRRIDFYLSRGFYDTDFNEQKRTQDIDVTEYLSLIANAKRFPRSSLFGLMNSNKLDERIYAYISSFLLTIARKHKDIKMIKPFAQLKAA